MMPDILINTLLSSSSSSSSQDENIKSYTLDDRKEFLTEEVPPSYRYQMMAAFAGINAFKLLRSLGIRLGPNFIDHVQFPLWRPAIWENAKVPKGYAFVGIPQPEIPDALHPFDFARSTRYNNCISIRESPDPELLSSEDYLRHHQHGIQVCVHINLFRAFHNIELHQLSCEFVHSFCWWQP